MCTLTERVIFKTELITVKRQGGLNNLADKQNGIYSSQEHIIWSLE